MAKHQNQPPPQAPRQGAGHQNQGNGNRGPQACRVALRQLDRTQATNAGLLLQRYLPEPAAGNIGDPEEKTMLLASAIRSATRASALYQQAFNRRQALLKDRPDAIIRDATLKVRGRLIVGLGSENVLEAGITLNQNYGVPIIPGSGLKGLAAHYCNRVWGSANNPFKKPKKEKDEEYARWLEGKTSQEPEHNFHRLLFGNTDDSGCIIFHDAWWVPGSNGNHGPLVRDVMTPHHQQWLDGTVPPSDFDSPVPVPFLSTAGSFHVAVSWNGRPETPEAREQAEKWTQLALDLLKEALSDWGAGGKTSSGYGRLGDAPQIVQDQQGRRDVVANGPTPPRRTRQPGTRVKVKIVKVAGKKDKGHRVQEVDDPTVQGVLLGNRVPPKSFVPSEGAVVEVEVMDGSNPRDIRYQWPSGK